MDKKNVFIIIIIVIIFIAIVSCSSIKNFADNVDLEDIVNVANDLSDDFKTLLREDFTEEERYYIGRSTSAYILGKYELVKDEELLKYVNQIGSTISFASNKSSTFKGYRFLLFESEYPNAYATPGGFIFLSTGIFTLCENEDELAAVIAHEVEHIVKDHPMEAVDKATKEAALINIAKYAAKKGTDDSEILNGMVDNFGETLKDILNVLDNGYEKDTEYQADKGAIITLYNAGYSIDGLKNIIAKLPYSTDTSDYSSNHPSPQERITAIDDEINKLNIINSPITEKRTERFKIIAEKIQNDYE